MGSTLLLLVVIAMAWLVTLPAAALVADGVSEINKGLGTGSDGPIVLALVAAGLAAILFWTAQRNPVTPAIPIGRDTARAVRQSLFALEKGTGLSEGN